MPPAAKDHIDRIFVIAQRDGRYSPDAFFFVSEAISQTVQWIKDGSIKPNDAGPTRGSGEEFHVSGRELLTGFERLARERWGMMAMPVLNRSVCASRFAVEKAP